MMTRTATLLLFTLLSAADRLHASKVIKTPSQPLQVIHAGTLTVEVFADGSYALESAGNVQPVLRSGMEADLVSTTLHSSDYPHHVASVSEFKDELGVGQVITVRHNGLTGVPELVGRLRLYAGLPWGDLQTTVENTSSSTIEIRAIRAIRSDRSAVHLGGSDAQDRILSDSYSEDGPPIKVVDAGELPGGMYRAIGSQLIFNRTSGQSLFLGALSADRFLTIFHLVSSGHGANAQFRSYEAASTGTNEILSEYAKEYTPSNDVPLRLHVAPGASLSSEPVMFAFGKNYHQQLENYGRAIRILHKARVTAETPIGWWSWTAYYYGVTQAAMLTNAHWLAQNLEPLGYRYFQIDEGYQYARGEYATSDARTFPKGVGYVGQKTTELGLTFGLWVAPFQVSERSWVFQNHPEWLVHTRDGKPIHLGKVAGSFDELYALDTTHPGAQAYLRSTYTTLAREWNVRFIKMDFMDSAAVEGVFYRPDTSALQAQRIGLQIIREAVGEDVILDKDGSVMLTPVGIVDAGRTSEDTGHTFGSTRDAAPGVLARYYMNRNFYITDPDAFTVSKQIVPDRGWHGNVVPLTLDEAEVSIALSAVSGGMFEIGDDLPTLGQSAERLALVRNGDLLNIAKLGVAAVPFDLMTYLPEDVQPSIAVLHEDARQTIVTVFNWTEAPRTHTLSLVSLGLNEKGPYTATDVLRGNEVSLAAGSLSIMQPAHSVRMIKLIDASAPDPAPAFLATSPAVAATGAPLHVHAESRDTQVPVLHYRWEFGDGVTLEGAQADHAYTVAGDYNITVTASGLSGKNTQQILPVHVTGIMPTVYDRAAKQRPRS